MRRATTLPRGIPAWSPLALIPVLGLAASCSSGSGPGITPPAPPPCPCPEPPGVESDDDYHDKFDLSVTAIVRPEPSPSLLEEQDFTLAWEVEYLWEPCVTTGSDGTERTSTPGRVHFQVIYELKDVDTGEVLLGPTFWGGDVQMGEMVGGSVDFAGIDVPRSRGVVPLSFEVRLFLDDGLECSADEDEDLLFNNESLVQFAVEDCPCDGGFASKTPYPLDLVFSETASALSWKTDYQIGECGEDGIGLTTGAFQQRVVVLSSTGALLFERGGIPGLPMIVGTTPDPYTVTIPAASLTGGPYEMSVELVEFAPGEVCEPVVPALASITVP